MFRLLDFSLPLGRTNNELITGVALLVFGTCICCLFLSPRLLEWEARRQVEAAKLWGIRVDDEAKELKRTKKRLVIACSVGLVVGLFLTARVCVELLRRFYY